MTELTPNPQPPSQPRAFRRQETRRLLGWVRHGESALVVGVSGVGKSNLFLHLLDPATQAAELGQQAADTVIARVNLHFAPDFSDRTLYSLILGALEGLADEGHPALAGVDRARLAELHDRLLDAGDDTLRIQRAARQALGLVLAGPQRRLALLFDQFDELYRDASPRLFVNLRGLREAFKYRLAFVFFTRDVLDNLAPPDPAREELQELVANQTLGLVAGDRADAEGLLARIAARRGQSPMDLVVDRLFAVTGGHAGLLRAAYLSSEGEDGLRALVRSEAAVDELARALVGVPAVERECRQIWRGLPLSEQSYMATLAKDITPQPHLAASLANLQLKGLVVAAAAPKIFAPLLAEYIAHQPAMWRDDFVYDEARRVIIVQNQTISLTPLQARLFGLLWQHRDRLVSRGDLIAAGWPHDGEQSDTYHDQSLTSEISRLRSKIEPDPDHPRYLLTVSGGGYRLNITPSPAPSSPDTI
jgi:DNA-binding winged helix-turn-helix (wHTH) protein